MTQSTEVATPNGNTSRASTRRRATSTKQSSRTTSVPPAAAEAEAAQPVRWDGPGALLQRVILPRTGDPLDVRALYLDEDEGNRKKAQADGRTVLRLPAGSEISFASYFNAFPASYWRRWTRLEEVELRLAVDGECRIDLYRSKADGTQIHVRGTVLGTDSGAGSHAGADVRTGRFTLDLQPFEDGGWYWFDLTTDAEPVTLLEAGWYAPVDAPGRSSVAIGITTFNRPDAASPRWPRSARTRWC